MERLKELSARTYNLFVSYILKQQDSIALSILSVFGCVFESTIVSQQSHQIVKM